MNEISKKPYKRTTILIKKGLQLRYMSIIFLSVVVGFLIVGFEIGLNLHRLFSERPALLAPLMGEVKTILPVFFIEMAIYLIVVLIVAAIISHRMAGPLYKFEKSADIIAKGDLTHRIYLRKHDHLVELQDEFNNMVSNIHKKVSIDHQKAMETAQKLKELASQTNDENLKRQLNEAAQKISNICGDFKI
jgi:methyl-accepting chemotaxis protein